MRARSLLGLGITALLLAGCITVVRPPTEPPIPSNPPTLAPTEQPTPNPTAAPTPARTLAPGETPAPTPLDLRPFLTAGVTVYNLGDGPLFLTVSGVDPESGDATTLGSYQIAPEQFTRQAAIPIRLRFEFSFDSIVPDGLASCTLIVGDADEVDFVVVAVGVSVTKNDVQPDALAEMVVGTSSLCLREVSP